MTEKPLLNTHGVVINYGKHMGVLITRVPAGYLRWMVNENAPLADVARAELVRRKHTLPQVEISGHALDSASFRAHKIWERTRSKGEGLHSWLSRVTLEAMEHGEKDKDGRWHYIGLKLIIHRGEEFPVLVTVMTA